MSEYMQISKQFIEKEIPKAPSLYVSIYLMAKAKETATTEEIANDLGILESDVIRAFAYWQEREVIEEEKVDMAKEPPKEKNGIAWEKKPEYTTEEIGRSMQQAEVKEMVQMAQKRLGRLLTKRDMEALFGFYDWLGLPLDVIDILIAYCASNQKTSMGYIERVAIDWAKESISSVEQAEEYIHMRNSNFGSIMRGFGQSGRAPVDGEVEYMKTWLRTYKMPIEIIKEACERTVMQIGKVSYPYADRILKGWNDQGVRTLADVEKADQAFIAKKAVEKEQKQTQKPQENKENKPQKQNKFINYTQRKWDFEKLEQLQREKRDQW